MSGLSLPTNALDRKHIPVATGLVDYFPDALVAVARLSQIGNDKHNPGQPLHWSRDKSNDHPDCLFRHFIDRGKLDPEDGVLHSVKVAWRALAILQLEIEALTRPETPAKADPQAFLAKLAVAQAEDEAAERGDKPYHGLTPPPAVTNTARVGEPQDPRRVPRVDTPTYPSVGCQCASCRAHHGA